MGDYKHHDTTWKTSSNDFDKAKSLTKDNSGANLWVFLTGSRDPKGPLGRASMSGICDKDTELRSSLSCYDGTVVATAMIVAHETGHNLGMNHDFIHNINNPRTFKGESCNNKGIMSYGRKPKVWSKCSRNDFLARYNEDLKDNQWCLKGNH